MASSSPCKSGFRRSSGSSSCRKSWGWGCTLARIRRGKAGPPPDGDAMADPLQDGLQRVAARQTRATRDARRARRWQRRKRRLLRVASHLALLGLIGFLWLGPFWRWEGLLTVTGNRLVSAQEVFSRLYIPQRTPLYMLNPQQVSAQLASIPAVARVSTRRWLFPPRLEVMILERQALVKVEGAPGERVSRWIDQEGVVFSAPSARMEAQFPVRVWCDLQPGQRLPKTLQAEFFEFLAAWPAGQPGRLDLRRPNDLYASVGGWPVRFGEPQEASLKLSLLADLQPLAKAYRERLRYINLRFPKSPTFMLKTGDEVKVGKAEGGTGQPVKSPTPKPAATIASPRR
ncbi:MAG: FtsQ-type POTRA domain-containing protein [Candidatus Sericytochromatia bacterium]|nr:FtsQ-type POTRA domain-containing protein [Candidatus Sericytochromatia bacterium]